jgi:toxin ParE1/3/4
MSQLRLSAAAEHDIENILEWTQENFGEQGRLRYEELLRRAIMDVAAAPRRLGSMHCPEVGLGVRVYHLQYSRHRVERSIGRVRRPRHILIYRSGSDGVVQISRVLHDGMELGRVHHI